MSYRYRLKVCEMVAQDAWYVCVFRDSPDGATEVYLPTRTWRRLPPFQVMDLAAQALLLEPGADSAAVAQLPELYPELPWLDIVNTNKSITDVEQILCHVVRSRVSA